MDYVVTDENGGSERNYDEAGAMGIIDPCGAAELWGQHNRHLTFPCVALVTDAAGAVTRWTVEERAVTVHRARPA